MVIATAPIHTAEACERSLRHLRSLAIDRSGRDCGEFFGSRTDPLIANELAALYAATIGDGRAAVSPPRRGGSRPLGGSVRSACGPRGA
mgnify:FL=1